MTLMSEAPKFLRRSAPVPAAPPPGNPLQEGLERWEELRSNYMLVRDALHQTEANALELSIENDSLRREIENLRRDTDAEIASLKADNRWLESYATGLRTRLTVIKEAIIQTENEALKYADHAPRQPAQSTPEEAADAREAHDIIVRANTPGDLEKFGRFSRSELANGDGA
jgi:hypothetical protein